MRETVIMYDEQGTKMRVNRDEVDAGLLPHLSSTPPSKKVVEKPPVEKKNGPKIGSLTGTSGDPQKGG